MPENSLKFVVGILMSAFGLFWFGEGIGLEWPYADAAILGLMAMLAIASWLGVALATRVSATTRRVIARGAYGMSMVARMMRGLVDLFVDDGTLALTPDCRARDRDGLRGQD